MTHAEKALDYLWSIAPDGATNGKIARYLGTTSQTAYMLTQDLLRRGLIRGEQHGRTWVFFAVEEPAALLQHCKGPLTDAAYPSRTLGPTTFEDLARQVLSEHYGVVLSPGSAPEVRKKFDLVSADGQIIGDAKYYTRVGGTGLPPAKFSVIAEHVWLLEKTGAPTTFLVFGNDRQVPVLWLERYGNLVSTVTFYFLTDDGRLEHLPLRRLAHYDLLSGRVNTARTSRSSP